MGRQEPGERAGLRSALETGTSNRLLDQEGMVARSLRATIWQRTTLSVFVTSILVIVITIHSATIRHVESIDPAHAELRLFGDPAEALARIRQEHFIPVERLEELATGSGLTRLTRLAYEHSPLLLDNARSPLLGDDDDVPIGVYYTHSVSTFGTTELVNIEYWLYFSDENVGMDLTERMARYGHPLDRELVYYIRFLNGEILDAHYQAPIHDFVRFEYRAGSRPVFRVASANHNFALVHERDLALLPGDARILAPRPLYEPAELPFLDPDIIALAAQEALRQHGVNMTHYVYVGIGYPSYVGQEPYPAAVDIGVFVRDRWIYLHDTLGHGVAIYGFRLMAIPVGGGLSPRDVKAVHIITRVSDQPEGQGLRLVYLYTYSGLTVAA